MNPSFTFKTIPTSSVKGQLFFTQFLCDDRPIRTSIQNFGVMHPLSVLKKKNGELFIFDGWTRLLIAKELSLKEVPCQIYSEESLSIKDAFLLSLDLNSFSRVPHIIDKAFLLKEAEILFGAKIPKAVIQKIGIKNNFKHIHQFKEILKLPDLIKKYVVNNSLSIAAALLFLRIPKDQVESLAHALFVLPLNQNKLIENLGLLIDLSRKEGVKAKNILDEELSKLNSGTSVVQKEQKLRKALQKRKNPHYESQLQAFEKELSQIKKPTFLKVAPAPYFDNDSLMLSATVSNQDDLKKLSKSLVDGNWNKVFDLI